MAKSNVDGPAKVYNNQLPIEKSKKMPKNGGGVQKQRKRRGARNAVLQTSGPKNADPEAADADADAAAVPMCARYGTREMRSSTSSSTVSAAAAAAAVETVPILENRNAANDVTENGSSQAAMSSSETAEPPGWLRLGDMAIGDGGVCVTSLIKDKIREYMLNEEQQLQQTDSAATEPNSDGTCLRRIGNSVDMLPGESRNAGHAMAAATTKNANTSSAAAADDRPAAVSTVIICAPADSSRPTAADISSFPPPPPSYSNRYSVREDEMQISRMPIPADSNCSNSEVMSVDAANSSDAKSDLDTTTKVNGDSHKKLINGSTAVESSNETNETGDIPKVVVIKDENIKSEKPEEEPAAEVPKAVAESLSENTEELVNNGASKEQQECDGNVENPVKEETSSSIAPVDDNKQKDKAEEVKPQTIENQPTEVVPVKKEPQSNEVMVIIKKEPATELDKAKITVGTETRETEKLQNSVNNGEVSQSDEVIKNGEDKIIPVNGRAKLEEDKIIEPEKEKVIQKVPDEEDMSSEMSTDALSPKQIDEPVARKRSAASHDELSVVSGASSDNDLPKTKKLRSEEDAPLLKDDTRERLIKNIVQSSGKNEVELTRNIEKIQNEIKVITDIAQTKRDELVTLIRLQKLKEEIIERLVIKVKEMDAMKTDNSKDWNLPEMFQINLSQPEHILSEKNISEIIDNRDGLLDKSMVTSYEHNNYATSSSSTSITPVVHHATINAHPNDWILSDRANRTNRVQRVILPKPTPIVQNQKEGRQGPILDVKLIIADHRSKNPETAVPKRGRRKATVNDFSVPTSSTPLRYPNPMGFGNPVHHTNDGNFKSTVANSHGVPNNVLEHGSDHNRFKDVPAFPEVTLHPVSQPIQQQLQQPTSLLHGILTKGTHHLPMSMSNPPTNYSPTLARLLTAPERCKQTRGKQRQPPAATVVSSNTQSRNEITITPVQSTSMSTTFQQKPSVSSNIPSNQVDDEDASDRLVIDEGQDVMNANSPSSAPQCQGCMQKPAQFVCAGCGNQWYCSKDCQIDAWDDHSEVCSG